MNRSVVAVVRYEKPGESVRRAVEQAGGFKGLSPGARVFVKPNIVFWTRAVEFPKWGVITTSRVVEDVVVLLKEAGAGAITIGEGTVLFDPRDRETPCHAFRSLGYEVLGKKYGVRCVNLFESSFRKVDLGEGISLNFSTEILDADFVVDLPVLKTHAQTVVSLGIKNLKGTIDIPSRKRCHNADPERNLNFYISRLADPMPPLFVLMDGIYTNERGPSFEGRIRRSDLLVASSDVFSADKVGARILGYEPASVPHLVHAARGRPLDLSDVDVVGEPLEGVSRYHEYSFPYNEDGTLPKPMEDMGIQGLSYPKYDLSLCTYCSFLNGIVLAAIAKAWKGEAWDDVEVLTGKKMQPTPGKKKTILLGKCMVQAHKDHPAIRERFEVKGCPPSPAAVVRAFHNVGIPVDEAMFRHMEVLPGVFMKRYAGRPEFDESFFRIAG